MRNIYGASNIYGANKFSATCKMVAQLMNFDLVAQAILGGIVVYYDDHDIDPKILMSDFYPPLEGSGLIWSELVKYLFDDSTPSNNAILAFSRDGNIAFESPLNLRLSGIFLEGVEYVIHVYDGVNLELYSIHEKAIATLLELDEWVSESFPGMMSSYLEESP